MRHSSTTAVVDLQPVLSVSANGKAVTVADPDAASAAAALVLQVSLTAPAASVNQIGFVAFNPSESDTLSYEQLRDRGTIILANLENSDTPDLSAINLERSIALHNGQKLVFFEVVDTTLAELMESSDSIADFGSAFRTLDLSQSDDHRATASHPDGVRVALNLLAADQRQGLNDLISSRMEAQPILDFRGLSGRAVSGSVSITREANYDSTIGFYHIQRPDGAVLDPITKTLLLPGAAGYKAAALDSRNLFSGFGNLSVANGSSRSADLACFCDAELLAPYATVAQTGDTWFAFRAENSDGLDHFRSLGSGSLGLEDMRDGFDRDFDDLVVNLQFRLDPVPSA